MRSLFSTGGLARASARHPWRVMSMWIVLIVFAVVAAAGLGDVLTTENKFLNEPESVKGEELLEDRLRGEKPVMETVVIRSTDATVDDAIFRSTVEQVTSDLRAMDGVVASATNYYETDNAAFVSEDRHTTLLSVTLVGTLDDAQDHTDVYLDAIEEHNADGFEAYTAGDLSIDEASNHQAEKDLKKAEGMGLPVALLILVVVFGALVAAGVPIALAFASIIVSLGLTALIGRAFELSFFVTNMITMIGLAVGIDYALFIIERYREERSRGIGKLDAIGIAGDTASKAVVFSGMTVVLALLGMFLLPISIFRSLGAGAVIVVLIAMFATLTLIPATLALLGDKIEWPRRRKSLLARRAAASEHRDTTGKGFWGRITGVVMAHPLIAVVISLTLLIGATIPYFGIETGQSGIETMPASDTKTAFTILQEDFYAGMIAPVEIVIDGNVIDAKVLRGIDDLVTRIGENEDFGPATVQTNEAGDLTLISAPLVTDANSSESYESIEWLRDAAVPAAFAGVDADVHVSGDSAFNTDLNSTIEDYTPIVFAFVLGLSFVLLMLAFRSIIVPITAIIMNLLSVGAAYGLLVLAFQHGWGEMIGLTETPTIDAWVPIFLFCILFGLSMDYHVFLLSRIREHFDLTGDNDESVAAGLQSTAKIITGAALIMVTVFTGFAMGELVTMQQVGFGLAVAVLLDATIVRSVLVPSTMKLLGNRNWYLPRSLGWLPQISIEGQPVQTPALAPVPVSAGDD
jgi:RND superfamily putative drug exporter